MNVSKLVLVIQLGVAGRNLRHVCNHSDCSSLKEQSCIFLLNMNPVGLHIYLLHLGLKCR